MSGTTKRRVGAIAFAASLLSAAQTCATPALAAPPNIVAGPAFSVVVSLSPKAAARLANPKETILVTAEFYGVPKAEKQRMELQGRLDLAPEQDVEIPGAGTAHFVGPKYDKNKLALVEPGAPVVALEIVSGRHSSPDNLLNCTVFEDSLALAASKPVAASCKLITEQ